MTFKHSSILSPGVKGGQMRCVARGFFITILLAVIALPASAGNGWGMSKEQDEELMTMPYRGKSPQFIARYFVHPNGHAARAAMKAMRQEHGEEAVPLLKQLLEDEHPMMRYSAVKVLGDILVPESPKRRGKHEQEREVTPQIEQLIKLIQPLSEDEHPAVSQAVSQMFLEIGVETPATRRMAIQMADSPDLTTRTRAIEIGSRVISDPDTRVKIGVNVSQHVNIPRVWGHAHGLIARHKKEPVSRQAVPALAHFLLNVANTRPVRGMFSDSPQLAALEVLSAQWDRDVEKMENTVPAVCCAYVRIPHSVYPGWASSRQLTLDIFKKMSPDAAPAIRQFVKDERRWLNEADEMLLIQLGGPDTAKTKAKFNVAIDYVEYVAECLEAGRPITKKSPIRVEAEKMYEDKVPEVGELDIEIELE